MKLDKFQKKILIVLLSLCLICPVGILLPLFFNTGDAWGEWSASTVKELTGTVPEGLMKYTKIWNAPVKGYTLNGADKKVSHQSGFYLVSGILGATLTFGVMILISKLLVRRDE